MDDARGAVLLHSRTPFSFELALAYFRRRAGELVDAAEDRSYRRVLHVRESATLLEARLEPDGQPGLSVRVLRGDPSALPEAAVTLRRVFGLDDDLDAFAAAVAKDHPLSGLLKRCHGLRLIRTPSPFEALTWAIIGQQINLTLAFRLKAALVRSFGTALHFQDRTYWAFPLPERLAESDPALLTLSGLSRRKAAAIVHIAREVASGALDLMALRGLPREDAAARLIALPNVGPWTAHYTLLRGLGDVGAFPASDLGLRAAAGRLYGDAALAPMSLMQELAERWGEWRGYSAFYLWNSLGAAGA